jgi:hypothetical protein
VGCAEVGGLSQPVLQTPSVVSNSLQFSFNAQYGVNYAVLMTTNLSPPITWQTQQTILFAPLGVITIQDPALIDNSRFYRLLAQ